MIAQFALRLICGMSLMWAVMPRRQVTSGFFRIQMLVVMGLGVLGSLATVMQVQSDQDLARKILHAPVSHWSASPIAAGAPVALIAFAGFLGSVLWTLERRTGGERIGFVVLLMSAAWLAATNLQISTTTFFQTQSDAAMQTTIMARILSSSGWQPWHDWFTVVSHFVGAAVLGGTMVGMLLGHWYLTTPTMSIEPLKRINLFLGIAGMARLLVSSAILTMLLAGVFDFADANSRLGSIPKMWLGLRWLAGVFGPLVVSLMVWRILKYRNTQAATGVLFVGVILAFIGDMTAALLLQTTKLPL